MADILTKEERSKRMSLIKSRNTKPELIVRRLIHRMGYRFRLHQSKLPGHPDLVFKSKKKVIFVNGCFWHGHNRCAKSRIPKSNKEYWKKKIHDNKKRDALNKRKLTLMGWKYLVIWECELSNINKVIVKVDNFLTNK